MPRDESRALFREFFDASDVAQERNELPRERFAEKPLPPGNLPPDKRLVEVL